jgi:hypothetical protein
LKQIVLRNLNLGDRKRDLRGLKSHPTKKYLETTVAKRKRFMADYENAFCN